MNGMIGFFRDMGTVAWNDIIKPFFSVNTLIMLAVVMIVVVIFAHQDLKHGKNW